MKVSRLSFMALAASAIMAVSSAVMFQQAEAEDETKAPIILVVDQQKVIGLSKAGKSIGEQMQVLQNTANKKLEAELSRVAKDAQAFQANSSKLPQEEAVKQAQALQARQQQLQMMREVKVRELQMAEQNAIAVISNDMKPVLQEILDERGATVLFDRSSVMYAHKTTDISDLVLQKLDEKLTTVKVEYVPLTAQK